MDSKESESADSSQAAGVLDWKGPHSVIVPRSESGFGFTLRHFVVYPPQSVLDDSKSENEFHLEETLQSRSVKGGGKGRSSSTASEPQDLRLEPQDTIFVKSVKAGSPAQAAGLNTGDRIVAVNGDSVTGKSYAQVIALIQASAKSLKLLVVPKDEDILQMAYPSEVGESPLSSNASTPDISSLSQKLTTNSQDAPLNYPKHSPTSPLGRYSQAPPTTHSTSSKHHQPRTGTRNPPLEQTSKVSSGSLDSASAKMSIASNIPSKTKYSFGLYFPPKAPATTTAPSNPTGNNAGKNSNSSNSSSSSTASSSRAMSSDNLILRGTDDPAMSKPLDPNSQRRTSDARQRKTSLDDSASQKGLSSSSARSRDYFIRYSTDKSNSDARNRYALRHSTHERSSSDKPTYVITRSQTVSAISPTHSAGTSSSARNSGDFSKMSRRRGSEDLEYKTEVSRQVHQVPASSTDSKLGGGGIKVTSYSTSSLPVAKSTTTAVATTANSGGAAGSKTFVVRIPCDQQQPVVTISQGRESTKQAPVRQSYGTAFALRRTPLATHIEIQKAIGKPIVSQRKTQFESKIEEPPQPTRPIHQHNRYKMEIDRYRTQPKFSSVANRKASFELSPEKDLLEDLRDSLAYGSSDHSDSTGSQSPKQVVKIRKISQERHSSATPPPQQQQQSSGFRHERNANTNANANNSSTGSYLDSSPIRIYVSPGGSNNNNTNKQQLSSSSSSSSSTTNSPVVEIVSVYPDVAVGDKAMMKPCVVETTPTPKETLLGSSLFQDDLLHQRHHSSPSPSSLSTGTMGDSGVWVKSYHGSCDMLDSGPLETHYESNDSCNSSTSVLPRQRHQSYLEAVNAPRATIEASIPNRIQQQQAFRGVHTQSPQQMVAQSQSVAPQAPSIAAAASSSSSFPSPSPAPIPPQNTSTGPHTYSLGQPVIVMPRPSSPQPPSSSSDAKVYHHHHRSPSPHLQQQQQQQQPQHHLHHHQQQPFPGSSSTHSLSSIGSDTAQSGGMSINDSNTSLAMATGKPAKSLSVPMRRKAQESLEDQANKLHRRTSYLMATAKDRTNTVPIEQAFSPVAGQQQQQQQQQQQKQQLAPSDELNEPLGNSARRESSVKLNKFFGEEIPSIAEGVESKSVEDEEPTPPPTPPMEVIRKGPLSCKIAIFEGKKCSDRTWKSVYTILRQTEMVVTKDPSSSASNHFETQHIPLKSCMVEFARDYAKKKKNVFRLTTQQECEYLFQAEDRGTMLCWIQALKSINEPDKAGKMDEMIAHETSKHAPVPVEIHVVPSSKLSPPLGHMAKKLSGLSLRSKLTSSPNMRRKKSNASEKDKDKPEKEESAKKSWKGRILMKNLKKHSEDSLAPPTSLDLDPNVDWQFGVPMEDCFPSPHNEYVPLIVELCTRIVEARGLEIIGVYRVPGNSAAVNALREEFNRGIDNVNIDNEKLLDINVISSLLKSFFRKLPEPLVNAESYDGFIEANRNPDPDKRMLKIKRLLHLLPTHHNETFKHMAEHLNKVASYGNINKMDAKNLAIMFGPTLIRKSNDDAVSLVTDMSDQCRIIESIILHHEWFFGQWDQDSHIPIETKVETVVEGHGEKDDDEEADSAISTKEIISSIVGAASRKLRGQQQKSEDSLDSTCSIFSPDVSSLGSRSFYQDSKLEDRSRLTSMCSSKSHTSIASTHSEDVLSCSMAMTGSNQRLAQPDFLHPSLARKSEPDLHDLEFADACSPPSSAIPRHSSDESLLEKNDELEISHGLGTSMSRQTIHNTLKRIRNDVKTLLHTFEQKQLLEMERRREEQEMIEHEHLRTQMELEQEDSQCIDDWLAMRGAGGISSQIPDLVSSSFLGLLHPYDLNQQQQQHSLVALADWDRQDRMMERDRRGGGGVKGGLATLHPPSAPASFHSHQGSLDSTASRTSCDNPYDEFLNPPSHHHHPLSASPVLVPPPRGHMPPPPLPQKMLQPPSSKQKNIRLAVEKQHLRPSSFRHSMGRRHGSLDSLIDLIDKRSSWASSDSEDGSDLLTSLTTTFDQKLQILVNPKYKLTGTSGRKHLSNELAAIVSDMKETVLLRSGDAQQQRAKQSLPAPPPPLGSAASLGQPIPPPPSSSSSSTVLDPDRPFRDPSLHRPSKPDAKVGIASRFERSSDNRALSSSPVMNSSGAVSSEQQKSPKKAPLPDYGAFLNRHNGQVVRDGASSISLTQPKKLEDPGVYVLRSLNKSRANDFPRSISKSEKTEMNSNLARLSKEEKGLLGGNQDGGGDRQENKENKRRRKSERKQGHRRHTVGGTQDFEHIDALVQVCGSSGGEEDTSDAAKMSAWDQLRPVVRDGGDRNLQSWLQKERTRGSTPELNIQD